MPTVHPSWRYVNVGSIELRDYMSFAVVWYVASSYGLNLLLNVLPQLRRLFGLTEVSLLHFT